MLSTVGCVLTFPAGGVWAKLGFMVGLAHTVITSAGGVRVRRGGDMLPDSLDGINGDYIECGKYSPCSCGDAG